jgi:hypothetical protein
MAMRRLVYFKSRNRSYNFTAVMIDLTGEIKDV